MKVVDANVLLYAVDADALHHEASSRWLDDALSGADLVGFAWVSLLAFLRLSTKVGLYPDPLTVEQATTQVEEWTSAPSGRLVHPGPQHVDILGDVLRAAGSGGNLVNDAHLVAIAREQRGSVVSYDSDFARLGVACHRPDDLIS